MVTWAHRLRLKDVFRNEEMTFEKRRDAIVQRIKASSWYTDDEYDLINTVEELEEASDADQFDEVWNYFYDWADVNRVWVETC